MIPKNISREHIIRAIEEAEKAGIPKTRGSRRFLLEYRGKALSSEVYCFNSQQVC